VSFSSRRAFLKTSSLAAASALAFRQRAHAQPVTRPERFLFVLTANGGAGIVDGLLPVPVGQIGDKSISDRLISYPDAWILQPNGSNLKVVKNLNAENTTTQPFKAGNFDPGDFLKRHGADVCVVPYENSSVNHNVGQTRAITGDGIDSGRTIQEAVAERWGSKLAIANCNMSSSGYATNGARTDTPGFARGILVDDAQRFSLGTHGFRGLVGVPSEKGIAEARSVRLKLEQLSSGASIKSPLREEFLKFRGQSMPQLEAQDLVSQLLLIGADPASGGVTDTQLAALGLSRSPDFPALAKVFPLLGKDDLYNKTALAFLLAKYGVSTSISIGLGLSQTAIEDGGKKVLGSPIAFDYSHANHTLSQNVNWMRILEVADGLVSLLKSEPHGDGSMWDKSLIYIATEFGRTRDRPPGANYWALGSAHELNNGAVLISPMLKGNAVYGGVDPKTLLTYGCDPKTGRPEIGSKLTTKHVYSAIAQVMDVPFSGRIDMSGLIR
jgi:hypothetical protein